MDDDCWWVALAMKHELNVLLMVLGACVIELSSCFYGTVYLIFHAHCEVCVAVTYGSVLRFLGLFAQDVLSGGKRYA